MVRDLYQYGGYKMSKTIKEKVLSLLSDEDVYNYQIKEVLNHPPGAIDSTLRRLRSADMIKMKQIKGRLYKYTITKKGRERLK